MKITKQDLEDSIKRITEEGGNIGGDYALAVLELAKQLVEPIIYTWSDKGMFVEPNIYVKSNAKYIESSHD